METSWQLVETVYRFHNESVPGRSYAMDIFHAERHTRGSNFEITTNIACFTPGVVR